MVLVFIFIFCFASGPGTPARPEHAHRCTFRPLTSDCDPSAGATAPIAGELFTQQFKAAAYIIACTINWLGLFVLGMVFPIIVVRRQLQAAFVTEAAPRGLRPSSSLLQKHLHAFCFLIFLFFCTGCLLFIKFNVPEIKNQTALQIAAEFQKMHAKVREAKDEKLNRIETLETKL